MIARAWAILLVLLLVASGLEAKSAQLYMRSWGNPKDPAIVFLHGGPGYNCASFEITLAEKLAATKRFVVAYDQRGAARSRDVKAKYTFDAYVSDLLSVYKHFKVKQAVLIGHSFGGALALKFAEAQPEKVSAIVLVGAPINYPTTFDAIRENCRKVYTASNSDQLAYIDILDTMDRCRLDYATYCFAHAMQAGLYRTKDPSPEAKAIYQSMQQSPDARYLSESTIPPVKGFYNSSRYTTLDHSELLKKMASRLPIHGFYGAEDGLFTAGSLAAISRILGEKYFRQVEGASHAVFIDQQAWFLEQMKAIR